jgi:alkylhydroperoxidase family enzyme
MIKTEETQNHRLSSILNYVKKLTLAPSTISNEDKLLVNEAGFSDEQLKDAIAVCAAFNLFNRIVEGHGVTPKETYKDSAEMIKKHGYDRRY